MKFSVSESTVECSIQRRAYRYRNFENYRLCVLVECGEFQL